MLNDIGEGSLQYAEPKPFLSIPFPQNAKRSLFIPKGITLQLINPKVIESNKNKEGIEYSNLPNYNLEIYENNDLIFNVYPLIKELYNLGYPLKSLNSILRCGQEEDFITAKCDCGVRIIPLIHHCDSKTCQICSLRRKKRLRKRFLPFLRDCKLDNTSSLYFLTISPKNYFNLEEGLKEIRKDLAKWVRHKYLADRIKGGFFVIETKEKEDGTWNIHLHMVIYGRRLDNRIRGQCLECNQNLLFYNRDLKKYYCANKKCNSMNVVVRDNSKLNQLWIESTGHEAHFHITHLKSASSTLNYMLKYVSMDKENFQSIQSEARYIIATRGKRLVSSFGTFYKIKLPKLLNIPRICPYCNKSIELTYNSILVSELLSRESPPPNNPSVWNGIPHIEYVKISERGNYHDIN